MYPERLNISARPVLAVVSDSARNRPAANSIERRARLSVRNQPVSVPLVTSVARRSISIRVGNVSELIHSSPSSPLIMMIPSVPEEPSAPEPHALTIGERAGGRNKALLRNHKQGLCNH